MRQAPTELSHWLEAEPGSAGQSASRDGEAWPPQVPDHEDATFAAAAAVAAERARIAREMRDSASKSLLGIAIAAASLCAPKRPSDPRWLEQRLRDLARLAQHAVSETHSVIDNLGTRITVQIPVPASGGHQPAAAAPPPVRVVVAEENPVLRSGLRAVLECAPELEIVAEACSGKEAVKQVRRHGPDVLLFDAGLQMADGPAVIPQISELTRVVVLTCADDGSLSLRTVDGGAHCYAALGEFEPSGLIQVVHDAAGRSPYLAPPPRTAAFPGRTRGVNGASLNDRGGGLTPREREVMGLIAEGLSNRQIAARLVISEKTVKNHICSIYQRIGVEGRSEAVSRWRRL